MDKKFVFLAHWVENWNWWLWFAPFLHKNPKLKILFLPLWPICAIMSVVYFCGKRPYDMVDKFKIGKDLNGETWLVRNMAWAFMLKSGRKIIRKRILRAVLSAQKSGANVIGLGALIKAEWLTGGGQWIVDSLGNDLKIPVIHGDTLTAATIIKRSFQAINKFRIDSPVFITGATSKIGRAVVLILAQNNVTVKMFTESSTRFEEIRREAGKFGKNIILAKKLEEGNDCKLWLTGKSKPAGKKLLSAIPANSVVINFSVPNPLGEEKNYLQRGIIAVEGGLLKYDSSQTNLRFTMRLRPGITYACHAGTMVHAELGWLHHEVGKVNLKNLSVVWKAAEKIGFSLPSLPEYRKEKLSWIQKLALNPILFI